MLLVAFIIVAILTLPLTLWLFAIRRYCVRNGKGYTPGTSWRQTMWIDWQEATEIAEARGELGMIIFCRFYLIVQLIYTFFFFIALLGQLLAT
jgi:hypothetical protein